MKKYIKMFVFLFLGCLLFWVWFTWYQVQREQVRQCLANYEQCQKDYYKATGNN